MKRLIINADGYGFTAGITRAIEECVRFGTVRSISANVNFVHADRLPKLLSEFPFLSVGCHVNPVVGRPVLDPGKVPSLVNGKGEFLYRDFARGVREGRLDLRELSMEMRAQMEKTAQLAGKAFTHIDFHMGLHRLPRLYEAFLDAAENSGVNRIRTHRYLMGMESRFPRMRHLAHMLESPTRLPKYIWNLWLRKKAKRRGFAMPDRWVGITNMAIRPEKINLQNHLMMLRNLPDGFSEYVAHPGYVDDELRRWSSYLEQRVRELRVLTSAEFRDALEDFGIRLSGYRDIPRKIYRFAA